MKELLDWLGWFVVLMVFLLMTSGCAVVQPEGGPPVFFPYPRPSVVVEPPPLYVVPSPITFHSYYDPYPYYGYDGWGYGNRFYNWGWGGGHHHHHHGWHGRGRRW